jgi:hypothetical protein
MHDPPPLVCQQHQYEQQAVRGGRDDEEISRDNLPHVILQERAPRLRRGPYTAGYVLRN